MNRNIYICIRDNIPEDRETPLYLDADAYNCDNIMHNSPNMVSGFFKTPQHDGLLKNYRIKSS